jgi:hypothetical protein
MLVTDIRQHLVVRGLDFSKYRVFIDDEHCIATFPLWNLSGIFCGYQQYNPNGSKRFRNDEMSRDILKYFSFVGVENDERRNAGHKRLAVWGLESIDFSPGLLFVTEGIFDAVKIHNCGLTAIAVLANDPMNLRGFLRALGRTTIAICDRDAAGRRLASSTDFAFTVPPAFHDLGEMSQAEVNEFMTKLGFLA